jgi:predicted TIM-barrel fold metal-dependent hydrolase
MPASADPRAARAPALPEILISVDDHMIEPPDVWQRRLPQHLKDVGPKVVETANGEAWEIDGERRRVVGISASANRSGADRFSMQGLRYADIMPGAYDAKARLADMDHDGVSTEILFNNLPGFAGALFLELAARNVELAQACVAAYNDWLAEDFCAVAPERLIPQCITPLWDLEAAGREVERAVELGHRGVLLPGNPEMMGLPSFEDKAWETVFSAAQEAQIPVVMHIAGSMMRSMRKAGEADTQSEATVTKVQTPMVNAEAFARLIFAGVAERFPRLKFVSAEAGVGWLPFAVQRMDEIYTKQGYAHKGLSLKPSEYFSRQFYASFILDDVGVDLRNTIGLDHIMWSTDYPHADSTFPHTQEVLLEHYGHLPMEDLDMIMWKNALQVYGIKKPKPVTKAPRQTLEKQGV